MAWNGLATICEGVARTGAEQQWQRNAEQRQGMAEHRIEERSKGMDARRDETQRRSNETPREAMALRSNEANCSDVQRQIV